MNVMAADPAAWWQTPPVRTARGRFCHRFARTSHDWLGRWKYEEPPCARATHLRSYNVSGRDDSLL